MINAKGPYVGKNPVEFYRDMISLPSPSASLGLSVTKAYKRPLILEKYEFHNTCGEAMMPIDCDVYIHVAPASDPKVVPYDDVEVFRIPKGTMVTLNPGVWHHGPFCIDTDVAHTLIILPERLYAYDCTMILADEENKIAIEP